MYTGDYVWSVYDEFDPRYFQQEAAQDVGHGRMPDARERQQQPCAKNRPQDSI